jgi:hypothetical protein
MSNLVLNLGGGGPWPPTPSPKYYSTWWYCLRVYERCILLLLNLWNQGVCLGELLVLVVCVCVYVGLCLLLNSYAQTPSSLSKSCRPVSRSSLQNGYAYWFYRLRCHYFLPRGHEHAFWTGAHCYVMQVVAVFFLVGIVFVPVGVVSLLAARDVRAQCFLHLMLKIKNRGSF